MNYKYFRLTFTFLFAVLIGCENIIDHPTPPYQIDESLGYFPINIENNWHYKSEHNSFNHSVIVETKTIINGTEYFILSTLGEHSYPDTILIEDNIVWKFTNNEEVVWFNFNLENNSVYQYNSYNVRVETGIREETYIGEFTNCIAFYFDIPEIADEEIGYVFAKGLGVVRIPGAWNNLKLSSFNVNK